MKLCSIVGARPQFVKMAVICAALKRDNFRSRIDHSIIHTGQHYDFQMSDVFFRELEMPEPDVHLDVGSGSHAEQTGEMIKRLESALSNLKPDCVLLYGDTNSTLAGAVVCSKMGVPVAHIEAGLRSFNRRMPEEINRVVADHLSDILFCPTKAAVGNIDREGLADRAVFCGDIMYDSAIYFGRLAERRGGILAEQFPPKTFALATIHRAENTDDPERLRRIFAALESVARNTCAVALPLHPRTRKSIATAGIISQAVTILSPLSYLDMLFLERRARFIITDSGGVQKEAYFAQVPCITTRDETEWVETLENGCNVLTGADGAAITDTIADIGGAGPWTAQYGDGNSCEVILETLLRRRAR